MAVARADWRITEVGERVRSVRAKQVFVRDVLVALCTWVFAATYLAGGWIIAVPAYLVAYFYVLRHQKPRLLKAPVEVRDLMHDPVSFRRYMVHVQYGEQAEDFGTLTFAHPLLEFVGLESNFAIRPNDCLPEKAKFRGGIVLTDGTKIGIDLFNGNSEAESMTDLQKSIDRWAREIGSPEDEPIFPPSTPRIFFGRTTIHWMTLFLIYFCAAILLFLLGGVSKAFDFRQSLCYAHGICSGSAASMLGAWIEDMGKRRKAARLMGRIA